MYARRMLLMMAASLAIHAAFVLLAPRHQPPAPRPYSRQPVPVSVAVHRQAAKAAEAAPKEPANKPPEPKPEPPKPKPEAVKAPPPKEAPPPPKPDAPPPAPAPAPEPAAPKKPAPFVLSNVAMNGGVQVQAGAASNLFGDPTKDAAGFQKGADAPRSGAGGEGPAGDGKAAPRKVVVTEPKALNEDQARGVYPPEHRELGRVIRVELLLSISPAGEVVAVDVRKGSLAAFDEEARRTARKLRFRPATRDGVPIPYQLPWTVVFLPPG